MSANTITAIASSDRVTGVTALPTTGRASDLLRLVVKHHRSR